MKLTADQIFNRERFEAWLVNQPSGKWFNYTDTCDCLLASFTRFTTGRKAILGNFTFGFIGDMAAESFTMPDWAEAFGKTLKAMSRFTASEALTAYNRQFNCDLLAMNAAVELNTPSPLNTKE